MSSQVETLKAEPVFVSDAKQAVQLVEEVAGGLDSFERLDSEALERLGAVLQLSPFLKACFVKETEFLLESFEQGFDATLAVLLERTRRSAFEMETENELMARLRIEKRRVALLCAVADLLRIWRGMKITQALSDFACASINAAMDFLLLDALHGGKIEGLDPENPQINSGLIVLGMGKLGAGELNYSSDIDLIIFFEPDRAMKILDDDPFKIINRMARQFVRIMQERTADGYVFRTDLRLRPDPSSTPLIISAEAALQYYEQHGQNWERAAMIKARAIAGDLVAGQGFLKELGPYIWRRYLDFAAIRDVHSIKRQIHAFKGYGEISVHGHNVKLGRGGIREIEFFVQTQQLIAGGRNPSLRVNRTIETLDVLAEEGWIEAETRTELQIAYRFLRDLEHRLQMIGDEQTHTLPDNDKELLNVAHLCGYADIKAFSKDLTSVLKTVQKHYAELFETAADLSSAEGSLVFTGGEDDPETVETLAKMGFERPEDIMKVVKRWHVAKLPALQTSQARELLTELIPDLLQVFGGSAEPDNLVFSFDRFISGLPAGIQLFSILKANPNLNALLLRILSAAPRLANQIARKPHVFDAMLEPSHAEKIASREEIEDQLRTVLARVPEYDQKLEHARRFFSEVRFQIGCRFFSGALSTTNNALALSMLAEATIAVMLEVVTAEFAVRHGHIPAAQVCVLAMGKLGSSELTASSDLDLIFLYDFEEGCDQSDGEKSLDPSTYFIRLIQRLIAAMSAPMTEGVIFQLDFRLRPSGNAGPLATHVDGFLKYQREDAWVWESQALTRARPVAGSGELCSRVEKEIPDILSRVSQKADIVKEIREMRKRIEKEKGSKNPWEMKTSSGSLIDLEFIAQWLVLSFGKQEPQSPRTLEILQTLGPEKIAADDLATLLEAYQVFARILHLQRTCLENDDNADEYPEGFESVLTSGLDLPDMASASAYLANLKKQVAEIFKRIFDG